MKKGKSSVWTANFAVVLGRLRKVSAPSVSINELLVPQCYGALSAARAALLAALVVTGSSAALAQKGPQGNQRGQGVPNANLGLGQIGNPGARIGTLAPAPGLVAPPAVTRSGAAVPPVSGASALTPASGLPPPGQSAVPGLRLGNGNSPGSPPGQTMMPGAVPVGGQANENMPGAPSVTGSATGQIANTTERRAGDVSQESQVSPRPIPTCR